VKLINKYKIEKTDGTPVDPDALYFVLRYDFKTKDNFARAALRKYAIDTSNMELWEALRAESNKEIEEAIK
jgi:hypothetical protein